MCVCSYIHSHTSTCAWCTCMCIYDRTYGGVYGASSKMTVCGRATTYSLKEMFPNSMATIFLRYTDYFACDAFSKDFHLACCLFTHTKSKTFRKLLKIFISSLQFCCPSLVMTSKYLNKKITPRVNFVKRTPSSAFIDKYLVS